MPLGTQTQQDNKPYFLRIRTQDKNKQPIPGEFSVTIKDEQGTYSEAPAVKRVTGDLVAVKVSKKTINTPAGKQEVDDIRIVLEDRSNKEVYFVDARPSQLGRNLYNSILNLKSGENVTISIYQTKPNDDGKVYPGIALWQNEQLIKGKYSREELPQPEEIKNKKGELLQRDFSEINNFFFTKLKDIVSSFGSTSAPQTAAATPAAKAKAKRGPKKAEVSTEVDLEVPESEVTEDIPF